MGLFQQAQLIDDTTSSSTHAKIIRQNTVSQRLEQQALITN